MADQPLFALIRCDACGRTEQAEPIGMAGAADVDSAMAQLRASLDMPGWTRRPDTVARDSLVFDRHGQITQSARLIPGFVDFCPDCSREGET